MNDAVILDDFCASKACGNYREWEFSDGDGQPYPCWSCEIVGQSYHIIEIPDSCPYRSQAIEYREQQRGKDEQ